MYKFQLLKQIGLALMFLGLRMYLIAGVTPPKSSYLILEKDYPVELARLKPTEIYINILNWNDSRKKKVFSNDTVVNFKLLMQAIKGTSYEYKLIFPGNSQGEDSAIQYDSKFGKVYYYQIYQPGIIRIKLYNSVGEITGEVFYDFAKELSDEGIEIRTGRVDVELSSKTKKIIRRRFDFLSSSYSQYIVGKLWMLDIGIDQYENSKFQNCKSDAASFEEYFSLQYVRHSNIGAVKGLINSYVLNDSNATRDSILSVMNIISKRSTQYDCFILCFNGATTVDSSGNINFHASDNNTDSSHSENLLSLNELQQYFRLMGASKQLFISNANGTPKFKTAFEKVLIGNSPSVASLLDKNRILIYNKGEVAYDQQYCKGDSKKSPMNYAITSLDSSLSFFDIFDPLKGSSILFKAQSSLENCGWARSLNQQIDAFFEQKFLNEYNEIFGNNNNGVRGIVLPKKELDAAAGVGKKYALLVGTDKYANDIVWPKLNNPIFDASEMATILENDYGFVVQQLKNPPLDSIYSAIRQLYNQLSKDDQLVLYFAGHGYMDSGLLADGFIVCYDSKSPVDDPMLNTYISFSRLRKMTNQLPAKQIVVLLDVCHAGVFDEDILGEKRRQGNAETENINLVQFIRDKSQYKIRRIITSVGNEAAFDGKAGMHSPFANLLLQVLRAKGKGANGIITFSNLFAVLQTASTNENEALKISPHIKSFGDDQVLGEFIFIPE